MDPYTLTDRDWYGEQLAQEAYLEAIGEECCDDCGQVDCEQLRALAYYRTSRAAWSR